MAKTRSIMDRRRFLFKSSAFLAGNLLGLSHYSKVLAADSSPIPPKIALIIDDIGFSRSRLMNFLEIDVPVTFSILPRLKQSQILAEEIHARGHEVMLHQPMEPLDPHVDPGPGAVYVGDDYDKILRVIEENISDLPFVTGINNHMGSRFTACREKIKGALIAIKKDTSFSLIVSQPLAQRRTTRQKALI